MKKLLFILCALAMCASSSYAQRTLGARTVILDDNNSNLVYLQTQGGSLAISDNNMMPVPCALLDLSSNSKGFLLPRLTQSARDAIASNCPTSVAGMLLYNSTTNSIDFFNGSGWVNASSGWQLQGNNSLVDGVNFIGTIDNVPVTIRVANQKAFRLESVGTSINTIGGVSANTVTSGVKGATLFAGDAAGANTITDDFGTISGGSSNTAGNSAGTTSDASYATIGGGFNNKVAGPSSVIAGGSGNTVLEQTSSILGGSGNTIDDASAVSRPGITIAGGTSNTARLDNSFIGGGQNNSSNAPWTVISGGQNNINNAQHGVIAGGLGNQISSGRWGFIGSGANNSIVGDYGVIGGGISNSITGGTVNGILGGESNSIPAGNWNFITGGQSNLISGTDNSILGGRNLTITGNGTFGFNQDNLGTFPASISGNGIAYFGNTDLWLGNTRNQASQLRFYEAQNSTGTFPTATTNYSAFQAGVQTNNITYTLPTAITGTNGDNRYMQMTTTTANTAASMSWVTNLAIVEPVGWLKTGNNVSGVDNTNNVIGSLAGSTLQPINIIANGQRVMRFVPNGIGATPEIIGGSASNGASPGSGGTIAGGGSSIAPNVIPGGGQNFIGAGTGNSNAGSQSVIGGGVTNSIGNVSAQAVIGGGANNTIDQLLSYSTIAGGAQNHITASIATIGGGQLNIVSNTQATVSGGSTNTASGASAVVAGGSNNTASSTNAVVSGGAVNVATGGDFPVVCGGFFNKAGARAAAVCGGGFNQATGDFSFIGGGGADFGDSPGINTATATYATILGGRGNNANAQYSGIWGGRGLTFDAGATFSAGYLGDNATGTRTMSIGTPNTITFGNTDLWLVNNRNQASELRFFEANTTPGGFPAAGIFYSAFRQGNGDLAQNLTYNLPNNIPPANAVLTSSGGATSNLSWSTPFASANAAASVAISNSDVFQISDDAANVAITATLPAGFNGQKIVVVNRDAINNATIAPTAAIVAPGQARQFVYANGWLFVN